MLFGIVIDAKVFPKRKYLLTFFGIICVLTQLMISRRIFDDYESQGLLAFVYNIAAAILDVTIESIIVQ